MKLIKYIANVIAGRRTTSVDLKTNAQFQFSLESAPAVDRPISMGYPRWKQLVPQWPTHGQFLLAWRVVFGVDFYACKIVDVHGDEYNAGFTVITDKKIIVHDGFIFHTDEPVTDNIIHTDGITWNTDKNGQRYYYINTKSNLPVEWEEVYSLEVLRRYCIQHGLKTLKS